MPLPHISNNLVYFLNLKRRPSQSVRCTIILFVFVLGRGFSNVVNLYPIPFFIHNEIGLIPKKVLILYWVLGPFYCIGSLNTGSRVQKKARHCHII